MLQRALATAVVAVTGHRICGDIPSWTAAVGQQWDTYDVAPWNLYNLIWRVGQWVVRILGTDRTLGIPAGRLCLLRSVVAHVASSGPW